MGDFFWFYRKEACYKAPVLIYVWDGQTGFLVGLLPAIVYQYMFTSDDSLIYNHSIGVQQYGPGFGLVAGSVVSATTMCIGSCSIVGGEEFPSQPVGTATVSGNWLIESTILPFGFQDTTFEHFTISFWNPAWTSVPEYSNWTPNVRCDSMMPGKADGCIFPDFRPVLKYSLTGLYPELASHILAAQTSGLPGAYPGTGPNSDPLRRLTDAVTQNLNRETACPDPPNGYPRPEDKSCDEYPFASTYEGATSTEGGPRTFDWCEIDEPEDTGPEGYSVCMINDWQNSVGGSEVYTQLISPNRVLDFDPYYVLMNP